MVYQQKAELNEKNLIDLFGDEITNLIVEGINESKRMETKHC